MIPINRILYNQNKILYKIQQKFESSLERIKMRKKKIKPLKHFQPIRIRWSTIESQANQTFCISVHPKPETMYVGFLIYWTLCGSFSNIFFASNKLSAYISVWNELRIFMLSLGWRWQYLIDFLSESEREFLSSVVGCRSRDQHDSANSACQLFTYFT